VTDTDRAWMQRCLTLAAQAAGHTAPNPLVGSVIVREGEVVGEGYHPQAGQPHAEVFALRAAGDRARGATLYVNLEPCNHTGRTPPCTEAILAAGIQRVVVGMVDPDPRVSGGGIARLRAAGLTVAVGVEEAACQRLNQGFVHRVRHQRPFGILKYAMTLDGKIAASSGHSAWVTSSAARAEVHRLRSQCDAVIVGGNTVRQDNPRLTSHGQGRNPLRVVMSCSLALPEAAHLWDGTIAPTVVFCGPNPDGDRLAYLQAQGVEVVSLPDLTPLAVLQNLGDRGHLNALWECGGQLAAAAIATGCVQQVWAFIAPKLIGGTATATPVGELNLCRMTDALPLTDLTCTPIGPDFLLRGYLTHA
jgi:diaminohydroxyphosphoribosylaminopyrimidine deaminase/5-amino-6-(5-phosphoribosylamino)uracil reductase